MLTQDICALYRELPVAVLIFQNEQLIHINKHLYEVFSLDELLVNLQQIKAEIYYAIFESIDNTPIQNDQELYRFLSERNDFIYKNQRIQINLHTVNGNSVFVLVRVLPPKPDVAPQPTIDRTSEQKLLGMFTRTERHVFELFSLYKGLHIKSNAVLKSVGLNALTFQVSKKHLCSVHDNNEFIIRPSSKSAKVIVANGAHVDYLQQTITLEHLRMVSKSAIERRTIRLKCLDEQITVSVNQQEHYLLYDLSLFSLALQCQTGAPILNETKKQRYELRFALQIDQHEYPIIIKAQMMKIMHVGSFSKVVLVFEPNEHAVNDIKAYLNNRQLELLRELKELIGTMDAAGDYSI